MSDIKVKLNNYTIKIETLVPTEFTYQVSAESPEEALAKITSTAPRDKRQIFEKSIKKIGARVYKAGTTTLALTKNF